MDKPCTKCKKIKPYDQFFKRKNRKKNPSGRESSCKQCRKEQTQARRETGEVQEYLRWYNIQRKYGLTKDVWQTMFDAQNGRCIICNTNMTIPTKPTRNTDVNIDHDHKTGKVRGMLCVRCNRGIGYFEENIDTLLRAVEYIQKG